MLFGDLDVYALLGNFVSTSFTSGTMFYVAMAVKSSVFVPCKARCVLANALLLRLSHKLSLTDFVF